MAGAEASLLLQRQRPAENPRSMPKANAEEHSLCQERSPS